MISSLFIKKVKIASFTVVQPFHFTNECLLLLPVRITKAVFEKKPTLLKFYIWTEWPKLFRQFHLSRLLFINKIVMSNTILLSCYKENVEKVIFGWFPIDTFRFRIDHFRFHWLLYIHILLCIINYKKMGKNHYQSIKMVFGFNGHLNMTLKCLRFINITASE